tara:strand:+ start:9666 stop:11441 length:1776 start_codon:yes stop_codon:yes gene_type:complete
MGIPSYFRTILERYPKAHFWKPNVKTDYLFIDFNSIIYVQLAKLATDKNANKTATQIDNLVIKYTIEFLQHLICDVTKPQKMVYIAFDGTVPMAKMLQSRARRFKSTKIISYKKKINKKHNRKGGVVFDKIKLSPGTSFMDKLSTEIKKAIKSKKFKTYTKEPIEFILSDTHIPGEGEHKYMPLIREISAKENNPSITAYSPDADVIVLMVSTNFNNMRVIRPPGSTLEREHYPTEEFIYVDIDETRRAFLGTALINNNNNKNNKKMDIRKVHDYVFLTAMSGNDFVVPVQYLSMRKDQMKQLMRSYKKISNNKNQFLIEIKNNKTTINKDLFIKLLEELAKYETSSLKNMQKQIHRTKKNRPKRRFNTESTQTPYDIDISRFEHEEYYSSYNPQYNKYQKEFDKINYFNEEWKCQYYNHFLQIDCNDKVEYDLYLKKICKEHIKSLMFTMEYYLTSTPAWNFGYDFRCAPLISDLLSYIKNTPNALNVSFDKGTPYKPLEQLYMVVPPQASKLLPKTYKDLITNIDSPLIQYSPCDFKLDVVMGQKFIYSEPILPGLDDKKIISELKQHKLTKTEMKRNELKLLPESFII